MRRVRQVALIVVCVLCMWCGSALAFTEVQMNDNYSLHELIQRYNDYCTRTDDNLAEFMLLGSPIRERESYAPYTTAYTVQNHLTNIMAVFCLNDNGKVVSFAVIMPKTRSSSDCAEVASRIIRAMNDGHGWENIYVGCSMALSTGKTQMVWSLVDKRYFGFSGSSSDCYRLLAFAYVD